MTPDCEEMTQLYPECQIGDPLSASLKSSVPHVTGHPKAAEGDQETAEEVPRGKRR